jgi:hypothetical protein
MSWSLSIAGIDACDRDLYQNFVNLEYRQGKFSDLQNIQRAWVVEIESSH